jgi:hypothetical protein
MYLYFLLLTMTLINVGNDIDHPSEITMPEFCEKRALICCLFRSFPGFIKWILIIFHRIMFFIWNV